MLDSGNYPDSSEAEAFLLGLKTAAAPCLTRIVEGDALNIDGGDSTSPLRSCLANYGHVSHF